jgi:ribosome biogenesis GTPase / thiamine phosphate phosphatase
MTFDLASLGWDATLDTAYTSYAGACHRPGRVARVDRGVCTILTAAGATRASLAGAVLAAAAGDPVALPCAGDWVVVRDWPDERATVEVVLPRRASIVRRAAGKGAVGQVLAANLDAAAVVEPMDRGPDLARIERLLALAWESGARPLVLLAKADLAADPDAVAAQVAGAAPGVDVIPVSALRPGGSRPPGGARPGGPFGDGLDRVRPLVAPGRTLALLGRSGAGKSTLVNALVGATVMPTQGVRGVDGKGRHTTTYRSLVPIPGGGAVLDTPGLRAVGLLDAESGLDRTFTDVAELAAACRFADCRHDSEPGCAVRAALESGSLAPRRLASWRRLQREIAYETRRRAARLRVRGGRP